LEKNALVLGDIFMDGVGAEMGLLFGIIVYTFLSGKFFWLIGNSKQSSR